MADLANSVNGVPIRLTAERWRHIVENHDEVAGYYDDVLDAVDDPDAVIRGYRGALIAVKGHGRRRYLLVTYREAADDGFIITAYFANSYDRSQTVWTP